MSNETDSLLGALEEAKGYSAKEAGTLAAAALRAAGITGDGALEAAGVTADAYNLGIQTQEKFWNEAKSLNMPWVNKGKWALNQLQDKIKNFDDSPEGYIKSPYFDWLADQSVQALDRSAAARGKLTSGAQQSAVMELGKNLASTDYDNHLQRYYDSLAPLQGMSEQGRSSALSLGNMGLGVGNNISTLQGRVGEAVAGGILGKANATAEGVMGAANANANHFGNMAGYSLDGGDVRASGYAKNSADDNSTRNALWYLAGQSAPYVLDNAGAIWDGAKSAVSAGADVVKNWFADDSAGVAETNNSDPFAYNWG